MGNEVGSTENCQYQCSSASNDCGTCIGSPALPTPAPTSAPTEATSSADDGVEEEVKETTTILQTVRIEITLFDVTGKSAHLLTLCRCPVCARLLSFSVSHWDNAAAAAAH